jgi:hypothetical protein
MMGERVGLFVRSFTLGTASWRASIASCRTKIMAFSRRHVKVGMAFREIGEF